MSHMLDTCCAFYHCFKDKEATTAVLREFRRHYPLATVHLISDGGDDFADVAAEFGCVYYYERRIGLQIKVGKDSLHEWLRRFERVCLECQEDWLLVLEDDVLVRKPIHQPRHAIEGANLGHKLWWRPIWKYVHDRHPNLVNNGYGGGGGSLVNREKAIEAIRLYWERENFDAWKRMCRYVASDIWLTVMFMAAGYQYGPCADLVQTYFTPEWQTTNHAIVHARLPVSQLLQCDNKEDCSGELLAALPVV